MADQTGNEVPETIRKRARRKELGSQTKDNEVNESCSGCHNMGDTIIEMSHKLDLVLARMEEIHAIKEKQKQLEKVNADLEKSLEFAHESIKILAVRVDTQAKTISELEKGVKNLTKSASFEKERAIKLKSHSWRNNLIFYGIPEEINENSAKAELLLFSFLEDKLKLKEDNIDGISIERAQPLAKRNANNRFGKKKMAMSTHTNSTKLIRKNARAPYLKESVSKLSSRWNPVNHLVQTVSLLNSIRFSGKMYLLFL